MSAGRVFTPPPQWGGLDLNSSNRGCARLGSEVAPPLGVVIDEVVAFLMCSRCFVAQILHGPEQIGSAELPCPVRVRVGSYDQGPEKALVQARRQAAPAAASGLLAAQRFRLCLLLGERVDLVDSAREINKARAVAERSAFN